MLDQARSAISELPPRLRQVIVLRDVERKSIGEVREALDMSGREQRQALQQARSLVRARLERYVENLLER
jgi:DNA-directed RNA polymerase specialized sigma24 family protein